MPLISIIVPVFKVEDVLHYCIESILGQTFTDFELILIDDGSPDNSGMICDKYAKDDDRIKVIHTSNSGVSNARNVGIKNSTGKYILFIDSDDYIDKDYILSLLKLKEMYPDYDNIWCGFKTVSNYFNCSKTLQNVMFDEKRKITIENTKNIMTLHEKWLDAGPYCKLFNREIINNNHIEFPVDLSLGEDLILNYKYLDCTNGQIAILNKCFYNYVVTNEESLGNKFYPNLLDIYMRINSTMFYYVKKWNCASKQISKFYNACFYKYEVVMKNTFHKDCKLSKKAKYKFNNRILRSKEFKESISLSSCFIHPIYRFAYMTNFYIVVQIVEKILSFIKI